MNKIIRDFVDDIIGNLKYKILKYLINDTWIYICKKCHRGIEIHLNIDSLRTDHTCPFCKTVTHYEFAYIPEMGTFYVYPKRIFCESEYKYMKELVE